MSAAAATASGFPTTGTAMLERLLGDRAFLIRTVVNDNYPAVRANFEAMLQSGQPGLINTPEKLANQLIWWNNSQGDAVVDPVIAVPYRNSSGSQVLNACLAEGAEMIEKAGGGKAFSEWGGAAGQFAGGLLGGIAGVVNGVANITNGRYSTDAQQAVAEQQIRSQFILDQERAARNAVLIKWGIGVAAVALVIIAYIAFRK